MAVVVEMMQVRAVVPGAEAHTQQLPLLLWPVRCLLCMREDLELEGQGMFLEVLAEVQEDGATDQVREEETQGLTAGPRVAVVVAVPRLFITALLPRFCSLLPVVAVGVVPVSIPMAQGEVVEGKMVITLRMDQGAAHLAAEVKMEPRVPIILMMVGAVAVAVAV